MLLRLSIGLGVGIEVLVVCRPWVCCCAWYLPTDFKGYLCICCKEWLLNLNIPTIISVRIWQAKSQLDLLHLAFSHCSQIRFAYSFCVCDNIWRCPVFNLLFVLLLMLRRWIVFLRSMATTVSHHRLRNATTGCFFIFLWTFLRYFLADWKVESQYCSLCKLNYHRGETLTMPC